MLIELKNRYHYETPIGRICIEDDGEAIIGLYLDNMPVDNSERETELIKETYNQLNEYFEKKRRKFDIPIKLHGSEFQNKVWNALCTIPYGETCTYIKLLYLSVVFYEPWIISPSYMKAKSSLAS